MAPNTTTGETLLDRSQRILGISLDDGEQEKKKTRTSSNKTNDGSASSRRREQIGQAQKTHRMRTQRYILELEKEVLRLRDFEQAARTSTRVLEEQRDLLLRLLLSHNISLPDLGPDSPFKGVSLDSSSSTLSQTDESSSTLVDLDMAYVMETPPQFGCPIQAAERVPPDFDFSLLSPSLKPSEIASLAISETTVPDMNGFFKAAKLDAQAGIDFILALEHPCLPHIKYNMENDMDFVHPEMPYVYGSGHVFTATVSLFHQSQSTETHSFQFQMPQKELDKLLDASKRLKLEKEVTPVQVWHRILDLAKQQPISQDLVDTLRNDCCKFTFCNGFGTVIDKTCVNFVFDHHFPQAAALS